MAPLYPPPAPGVTRLSQSLLELYLKCGLRYWFTLESERQHVRHATVRMIVGTAVAAAALEDNRSKARGGEGIRVADFPEVAAASYEREASECEIPDSKLEVARGKDDAVEAARTYALRVAHQVCDVVECEEPIVATVSDGFEVQGTPDLVTTEGLGELKVGKPWSQEEADRSRQLSLYGLLHRAKLGRFPRSVWVDSVFRTPKTWSATRLYTARDAGDYRSVLLVAQRAREGIEKGVALPAPERAWFCSATWCEFFRHCPAVEGRRKGTAS